jgi:hypothetical protein
MPGISGCVVRDPSTLTHRAVGGGSVAGSLEYGRTWSQAADVRVGYNESEMPSLRSGCNARELPFKNNETACALLCDMNQGATRLAYVKHAHSAETRPALTGYSHRRFLCLASHSFGIRSH